ncbi:MAG: insulinase family protein, partial [Rhodothermales bacterium]|nr:insulinase family protein [Rhodothermales bacterium]
TEPEPKNAEQLALDPSIVEGALDSGLRYLIRRNDRPDNRAELRLVLDAGSILENPDQLGLAHFAEHMAFNGTAEFPEQALVDYLESVGMRFGPDINAYTSFDETVYMLQLPTDSVGVLDTGLRILRQWAGDVAFDPDEIEKERGVVVEEWRLRRGGAARIQDRQLPVLLHDSRYADRLPIGTVQNLESFEHKRLIGFYEDWYRPDLMTVIAVGDFDPEWMEHRIRTLFSDLENPADAPDRTIFSVPDHAEPLYSIESDPEVTFAQIGVLYKHDPGVPGTRAEYAEGVKRSLFAGMLNRRLGELTQQADPPFIGAGSRDGSLVRTKAAFSLTAGVRDGEYLRALRTMLEEAERVRRHGFTETEFERIKTVRLRNMQVAFNERDNQESGSLAGEFVRHALTGEAVPGIEREYELLQEILPEITLDDVNTLVGRLMTAENQVLTVSGPASADAPLPSVDDVRAVFERVSGADLEPYRDEVSDAALVESPPEPGRIVHEARVDSLGLIQWTLSNGAEVWLRPTDFKADQVLFAATSPGGTSLASDDEYMSASFATSLVGSSGAGAFGPVELSKKLSGKVVNVRPYIGRLEEGFSGTASPEDLETLFQLTWLLATNPRADSSVHASFMTRISSMLETMQASPESAFGDTLSVTLSRYHVRSRPLSPELLGEVELQESFDFYRERFADFDDFRFYLVGAFEPDHIRPYVERWLASLPALPRVDVPQDDGRRTPEGVVRKEVRRGVEPKSRVAIVFSGEAPWSMEERRRLQMLQRVVDSRLRERLREDLGGTYGVSVGASFEDEPYDHFEFNVSFGCDPERVDELVAQVFADLRDLKSVPPDEAHVRNAREAAFRGWETGLRENGYWLSSLQFYAAHGLDPARILIDPRTVLAEITAEDVSEAARTYLGEDRFVLVTLLPEGE